MDKTDWKTFGLFIAMVMVYLVLFFSISHPADYSEIGLSLIQQDDIKQVDFTYNRRTRYLKNSKHDLSYTYHKTSDSLSRAEVIWNSSLSLQDINSLFKYEYYKEEMRRNRVGVGIGKEFGIFKIKQYFTRDFIHEQEDHNLFDTNLSIEYACYPFSMFYQYSFLTNFSAVDYKYIKLGVKHNISSVLSIAWELDRRWEETRKDLNRLLLKAKF